MPRVLNKNTENIPTEAVFVGRPSKWGNPFAIGADGDRDEVCDRYEAWFTVQPHLIAALPELRGKDLVCFCAPLRCHADFLLKLANRREGSMAVKRVASKAAPKKAAPKRKAASPQRPGKPTFSLPDKPKKIEEDIRRYMFLIYGREGIGKTSAFATFPDALFLSTEPGSKGLEIFDFNEENGGVTDWGVMRAAVDLLESDKKRFKNVIIDTADRAYDMCLDWVCKAKGIEYPGRSSDGKEDFGKSWRAVKQEFISVIHRIAKTGRGIGFVSHRSEEKLQGRTGRAFTSLIPSMSGQARKVVEALVDYAFYTDYATVKGERQRIFITQGDDLVWAKARRGAGGRFPRYMLMPDPEEEGETPYEAILRAFQGQHSGIPAADIAASTKTAQQLGDSVERAKARERTTPAAPSMPQKGGRRARRAKRA